MPATNRGRSLKTQQQTSSHVEVDVDLGEPDHGRIDQADPSTSLAATSGNCHWDP